MSIFQPSIFKGHLHVSVMPHIVNVFSLGRWRDEQHNFSTPWRINSWFTYRSHHPWKERNIIKKKTHDVIFQPFIFRGGSPPLFPLCCLCKPWLADAPRDIDVIHNEANLGSAPEAFRVWNDIPSRSLTARTWKWWFGSDDFPKFQGWKLSGSSR